MVGEHPIEKVGIAGVAHQQRHLEHLLDDGPMAATEVVEHSRPVAALFQGQDRVGADVARTASDQDRAAGWRHGSREKRRP